MGSHELEQKYYGLVKPLGEQEMKMALPIAERLRAFIDDSILDNKTEEMKIEIMDLYLQ